MSLLSHSTDVFLNKTKFKFTPYQVLVFGFFALILVGALMLTTTWASASGERIAFIDALFTATSAVCVTGLVVVDTGTTWSTFGQIIIIGLIQVGGLGIMTMATLMMLLTGKKIHFRERLIMQEALNQLTVSGVVRLTRYIIKATLIIEFVAGTILAYHWYHRFGLEGIYYGYWHAISSFCNAGFDLFGGYHSITGYVDDITVNAVISILIILGGVGFTVIADVLEKRSLSKLSLHSKVVLVMSGFLIIFGMAVICLLEWDNPGTLGELSLKGKLLAGYFQSVSARTAGYNSIDIGAMQGATLFFIIGLMFIGASPGSTGGGIKTTTAGVLVLAIWSLVRGNQDVEIFGRRLSQHLVYKAFAIWFIALFLVIFVTMMMSISEKAPFLNIMFDVVSAFGTVGLTTGITPTLTVSGKIWLILTMFAGRVGPVTLALAFALKQRRKMVQYPQGKVIVG
ncbi:MAG: potassium uptake protein, TrkH family [Firmicutes bacterium]|nr:potassium uptake protein, TrkH family [Bacillota bacterium]